MCKGWTGLGVLGEQQDSDVAGAESDHRERGRREGQGGERGKSWRAWWAVGEDLGLYPEGSRIPGVL